MKVSDLLDDVLNGMIVLPDFQRSFIWDAEDIRQLLVSILGDYFIGSILILEDLSENSRFALRLIEGVKEVKESATIQSIVKILLDGQQRTSALFYAIYEPDIPVRNRKSPYRYYLNVEQALNGNWDESVVAVSVNDKKGMSKVKDDKNYISFGELRDIGRLANIFRSHERCNDIVKLAIDFMNREINVVSLKRGTDDTKIVETFERINRTGEPLSIFDLLTARLYREKVKLRDLLEDSRRRYPFLEDGIPPEFILKVIALLRGEEPKRKNLLGLNPYNFEEDWERSCDALQKAYDRVMDVKTGYGVLEFKRWMPYSTLLVPLASAIYLLKSKDESAKNYAKIDKWFWVSVFSNRYDQAVDSSSYSDLMALKEWFNDDSNIPDFIQKFDPNTVDLDISKQASATYRGVICLIVLKGAHDFKTGQPPQFEKEKVQDDHIFPKSIYNEDCVLNRTLISTNLKKSSVKPSQYFKERLEEHGEDRLKEILESHIIPNDALSDLLSDNLEGFMRKRKAAIIRQIQSIIEK